MNHFLQTHLEAAYCFVTCENELDTSRDVFVVFQLFLHFTFFSCHLSIISFTTPPSLHHHNATLPHYHTRLKLKKNSITAMSPSQRHFNVTTTTSPQRHHNVTTTQLQYHHNTTTTPPQHHHNITTTQPQHHHHTHFQNLYD